MPTISFEQAATWAAAQRTGSAGAKAVLQFLTWALYDGKRPLTHAFIAQHAEVSVRSVATHLETLESLGLIRQTRRPHQPARIELLARWGDAVPADGPSVRFIGSRGSPAHCLFDWMLEQDLAGVQFRDVLRRGPRQTRTTDAAEAAMKDLQDLGYLEETYQRPRHLRLATSVLGDRPVVTSELPF
jgi:hypothetical protein